jgi:hypothetical protein
MRSEKILTEFFLLLSIALAHSISSTFAKENHIYENSGRQHQSLIVFTKYPGRQQQSRVVVPKDNTTMNLHWVPGKPDDVPAAQNIDLFLIRRYCTYKVDTKDLISGQVANKSFGWAVYPSLERDNQKPFPVELIVRTELPVTPHSNYHALVKKEGHGRRLQWKANERRIPSHFGYFGLETEEKVSEVEIRRECVPKGNGRALIKTTVRAQIPLLLRIWGLKRKINVEPESVEPQNYRLSDNGVLFFDYGKDPKELGSELEYRFTISGLDEGELFYPMTNALHHVQMYSRECPDDPMRQIRGSAWGFDFTLTSEQCFRIDRFGRWVNELYQLKALSIKPSQPVVGRRQPAKDIVIPQVRDYKAARYVPQPIELWKAKEYGCGGNPRTQQKLHTDVKRQYPIELTWPLIQQAGKYVIQIKGVRGSHPAKSFESTTNHLCLEKADIVPGRYQWSVSVYDKQGRFMGDIETIDPVEVFAIENTESLAANGKKVLLDLNHSAGHVRGWGYYNHTQYMTKELLENSGFQVQVNERDLLTADSLKSVDLLICHYYWTGWPDFRAYLKSEISAVIQFVENGGSLLVIGCDRKDGGGKMSKAANELIKEFGLMFELVDVSRQHGLAKQTSEQNVISFNKPVPVQLPVSVRGKDAITLLQFDGIPIVKAKQIGKGKVIVAGVGMSFLDCYLGDFEHREPLHLLMFYDFIKYLTDIEWEKSCAQDFVEMVISRCQLYAK